MSLMARKGAVLLGLGLVVAGLAIGATLWRSPEARKGRHLARADGYFSRQQYREAIIEYRNVLQVEKANGRAIRQLGLAHYELGELGHALRYLPKAQDLDPGNLDIRLKLGTIYLVAGQPQKAREEAAFILEKDPKRLEALGLLAGAAKTPQDIDEATRRLEKVRADFEDPRRPSASSPKSPGRSPSIFPPGAAWGRLPLPKGNTTRASGLSR